MLTTLLKFYRSSTTLLLAMVLGGLTGYLLGPNANAFKPAADLFLNLMFCIVIPLVFFSITSAIAQMQELQRLGKLLLNMLVIFVLMGVVASMVMLAVVKLFPPAANVMIQLSAIQTPALSSSLLPRNGMLLLILFAFLIGIGTVSAGNKAKAFANFFTITAEKLLKLVAAIMYYAPIGFFAYFAVMIGDLGTDFLGNYFRAGCIYYVTAIAYFIVIFSLYAFLADKKSGLTIFWKNISAPTITSFATCSSTASIPVSLSTAKNMGIPASIYQLIIPLGSIIHKQGSILGGMLKIAFLFTLFHYNFSGAHSFITAILISLMVGTVMGTIPSGGMLGELLIVSAYGFPPQALMMIVPISILIDAPATMLNVTGNSIACFLIAKMTGKKIKAAELENTSSAMNTLKDQTNY